MSGPYGKMAIPAKAGRGQIPEYNREFQPYAPGQGAGRAQAREGGLQGYLAAERANVQGYENLAGLARAADNLVQKGFDIYEKYSATRAQEAFNQYEADEARLRAELDALKGRDALDENGVMARLKRWRDESREKLASDLNPAAKNMFGRQADKVDARTDVWAIGKVNRENVNWQASVAEGTIANSLSAIMADPLNDGAAAENYGKAKAEYERIGRLRGWSEEETRAKFDAHVRKTEMARYEDLIALADTPEALRGIKRRIEKAGIGGGFNYGDGKADIRGMDSRVEAAIRKYSREYGVNEELMLAMSMQENSGKYTTHMTDAGVVGPMQVKPSTGREVGENDVFDLEGNIRAGIKYFIKQRKKFGNDRDALRAYNAGPGAYAAVLAGKRRMADETAKHAERVFGRIRGGTAAGGPGLLPGDRGDLLAKIERKERVEEARARAASAAERAALASRIKDQLDMNEDGLIPDNPVDLGEAERLFEPEKARAIREELAFSQEYAEIAGNLKNMTPEEQIETLERLKPDNKTGAGYSKRARLHNKAARAVDKDMKERAGDGSAYLVKNEKLVGDAFEAFVREPDAEKFQAYLNAREGAWTARKMPANNEGEPLGGVLPNQYARQLAKGIQESADPYNAFASLQKATGRHFNKILKQVMPKTSYLTQIALSGIDEKDARLLLDAAANPKFEQNMKTIESRITDYGSSRIDADASALLKDFNSTLLGGADTEMAAAINKAVKLLGCQYLCRDNTLDVKTAIRRAADAIVSSRYHIIGGKGKMFRVPASFDREEMDAAASAALEGIARDPAKTLALPERKDAKGGGAAAYGDQLRNIGHWATNLDESGVILFFGDKAAMAKDGGYVEYKWRDLLAKWGQRAYSAPNFAEDLRGLKWR